MMLFTSARSLLLLVAYFVSFRVLAYTVVPLCIFLPLFCSYTQVEDGVYGFITITGGSTSGRHARGYVDETCLYGYGQIGLGEGGLAL